MGTDVLKVEELCCMFQIRLKVMKTKDLLNVQFTFCLAQLMH